MVRCPTSPGPQGETRPMRSWRSLITWPRPKSPTPQKETSTKATLPETGAGRPLRLRLLFWIILALTPAATLALVQGWDRVQRDVADVRERLVQTAKTSASDTDNLLASEEQILRSLANQPEVRE